MKQQKKYRQTPKAKDKKNKRRQKPENKKKAKENYQKNKERINKRNKERYKTDEHYKWSRLLRAAAGRIKTCVKGDIRTIELLNCTFEEAKNHIISLFEPGMTWENDGPIKWQIDHRRCLASFDFKNNEEDKYMAGHWSNLQPMWAPENYAKGAYYDEETFTHVWIDRDVGWIPKN